MWCPRQPFWLHSFLCEKRRERQPWTSGQLNSLSFLAMATSSSAELDKVWREALTLLSVHPACFNLAKFGCNWQMKSEFENGEGERDILHQPQSCSRPWSSPCLTPPLSFRVSPLGSHRIPVGDDQQSCAKLVQLPFPLLPSAAVGSWALRIGG